VYFVRFRLHEIWDVYECINYRVTNEVVGGVFVRFSCTTLTGMTR
jgi:hypothetical protein